MISVMLCDDVKEIREHFKRIIDSNDDMQVVCMAQSGAEAIKKATEYKPDIVLMDIQMEDAKAGIAATEKICDILPGCRVIMLTIHKSDDLLIEAYTVGAVDYIIKETDPNTICRTIRNAYQNEQFIGTEIMDKVRKKLITNKTMEISMMFFVNNMSKLTNSEWKILKQLYYGKKRREIASSECLSEETVKIHTRHILKKLNFRTVSELVSYLKSLNIVETFHLFS